MSNRIPQRRTGAAPASPVAIGGAPITSTGTRAIEAIRDQHSAELDASATRTELAGWSEQLSQALGLSRTRHNPVWTPQAVRLMRSLQRRLLEAALAHQGGQRRRLLGAVDQVEAQIDLRLRLEQLDVPVATGSVLDALAPEAA